MSEDDDCTKWHDLRTAAEAEAAMYLPTLAGWDDIREATAMAQVALAGNDVRRHRVQFDADRWKLDTTALPQHVLDSEHVSRGEGFDIASKPTTASTNWQLFCTSFVFGYGPYGIGPACSKRIIDRTKPEQLCEVVAEARRRLNTCGPLSAYEYLRGGDTRGRVPPGDPRSSPSCCTSRVRRAMPTAP